MSALNPTAADPSSEIAADHQPDLFDRIVVGILKLFLVAFGLAIGGFLGIVIGLFTGLIKINIRC